MWSMETVKNWIYKFLRIEKGYDPIRGEGKVVEIDEILFQVRKGRGEGEKQAVRVIAG